MNFSDEDQAILDEKTSLEIKPKSKFQETINRYSLFIFLSIILLLAISVFVLLQRNQSNQMDYTQTSWQKLRDLPSIHFKPAVAVLDSRIFVIGGETQTGISAQTDVFDPKTNSWKTLANKPTPVSNAKAIATGGRIFVPGGKLADGQATDLMEMFDPTTNKWNQMANLPKPLYNYGLSIYSNNIYLFGGQNTQFISKSIFIYDTQEDKWSEEALIQSNSILEMGIVLQNNRFLLFGGSDGSEDYLQVTTYEPSKNNHSQDDWEQIATLPTDVRPDSVQLVGDFIFLLGRQGIWQFIPQNSEWILQPYQGKPPDKIEDTIVSTDGYLFKLGGYNTRKEFSIELFRYQVIYSVVLPNIYK